jgi:hypothetical protein
VCLFVRLSLWLFGLLSLSVSSHARAFSQNYYEEKKPELECGLRLNQQDLECLVTDETLLSAFRCDLSLSLHPLTHSPHPLPFSAGDRTWAWCLLGLPTDEADRELESLDDGAFNVVWSTKNPTS